MKAAPFDYVRPQTLAEAAAILAADEDARLIAGGQTLTPMMAMRLARPSRLVDIARLSELTGVREEGDALVIGAVTRQAFALRDPLVAARAPLLAAALPWVGHAPTRNRGTLGGSVANADPAAEIPLALATLDGAVRWVSQNASGEIAARDFFLGPMMTALPDGAIVTALVLPVWRDAHVGVGFQEVSGRRSDFAYVSAAAQVSLDTGGRCLRCAIAIGAACATPTPLDDVARALVVGALSDEAIAAALTPACDALDVMIDAHASPGYRRRAAATLAARALAQARDDARARMAARSAQR